MEEESMFTCCAWMSDTGSLALGTAGGCVKITNYLGQVCSTVFKYPFFLRNLTVNFLGSFSQGNLRLFNVFVVKSLKQV